MCSNNISVLAANEGVEESSVVSFDTKLSETTINLKGLSKSEVKKIFKRYSLEYDSQMEYDKIVVEQPEQVTTNSGFPSLKSDYSGKRYRIVNTYGNKPITSVKKTGKAAAIFYATVGRGASVAVGLAKKYVWIPYTVLGIDPSK
ncbi:MAG: hypothetical protein ACERKZ_19525 [Lachnotalea sp.]